jgi:hypothetical protein
MDSNRIESDRISNSSNPESDRMDSDRKESDRMSNSANPESDRIESGINQEEDITSGHSLQPKVPTVFLLYLSLILLSSLSISLLHRLQVGALRPVL